MKPSIFNDVIGPLMRGPSSSHTAASHRIGTIVRQLLSPENARVIVEFHRGGSLATTYEGQGSSMGLTGGLLGLSILDPKITRFRELSQERGLDIEFRISDYEAIHPNTYKIRIESIEHEVFSILGISTGGGMIEIQEINGFRLSLKGDYYETLACCVSTPSEMELLLLKIEQSVKYQVEIISDDQENFLFNIKSREPVRKEVMECFNGVKGLKWIRCINPVLPVLSDSNTNLPFDSIEDMLKLAKEDGCELAELAIRYESARAGIERGKIISMMNDIADSIKHSIDEGLKDNAYEDRVLGHQSHLIIEAEKEKKVIRSPMNTIIAYVTAIMESKSSMEIIVAAPTAGSCGVLGGALFGASEHYPVDREAIVKALLGAGIIGVFICDKYTFAAEEGGCQVECGAASAMAAAGLIQLFGGNAIQAVNASSMALQNCLGMICDPVADRVEVPCLGKNILAATNALNSANMILSGFDPVIPLDEVIGAMISVGNDMPRSLCCTGLGGLSLTKTSQNILEKLKKS